MIKLWQLLLFLCKHGSGERWLGLLFGEEVQGGNSGFVLLCQMLTHSRLSWGEMTASQSKVGQAIRTAGSKGRQSEISSEALFCDKSSRGPKDQDRACLSLLHPPQSDKERRPPQDRIHSNNYIQLKKRGDGRWKPLTHTIFHVFIPPTQQALKKELRFDLSCVLFLQLRDALTGSRRNLV